MDDTNLDNQEKQKNNINNNKNEIENEQVFTIFMKKMCPVEIIVARDEFNLFYPHLDQQFEKFQRGDIESKYLEFYNILYDDVNNHYVFKYAYNRTPERIIKIKQLDNGLIIIDDYNHSQLTYDKFIGSWYYNAKITFNNNNLFKNIGFVFMNLEILQQMFQKCKEINYKPIKFNVPNDKHSIINEIDINQLYPNQIIYQPNYINSYYHDFNYHLLPSINIPNNFNTTINTNNTLTYYNPVDNTFIYNYQPIVQAPSNYLLINPDGNAFNINMKMRKRGCRAKRKKNNIKLNENNQMCLTLFNQLSISNNNFIENKCENYETNNEGNNTTYDKINQNHVNFEQDDDMVIIL